MASLPTTCIQKRAELPPLPYLGAAGQFGRIAKALRCTHSSVPSAKGNCQGANKGLPISCLLRGRCLTLPNGRAGPAAIKITFWFLYLILS